MAIRICAGCQQQINTCDICGADWPTHMMDPIMGYTAGGGDAILICEKDWTTIRAILGWSATDIQTTINTWKQAHPGA